VAGVPSVTGTEFSSKLYRVGRAVRAQLAVVWALRAELLVAACFLAGWALVTVGIAAYTSPRVWPLSLGLLLLSLCGWKWLWSFVGVGLYTLIEQERKDG
jgi:hypothetical protein